MSVTSLNQLTSALSPTSVARDVKAAAMFSLGRTIVSGFALAGDPAAKVLGLRPLADPYPVYEEIRSRGELVGSRLGTYVTTSHAVSNSVLRDPRFRVIRPADMRGTVDWTRSQQEWRDVAHPIDHSLLTMNPPEHTRLRKLVSPAFTPRALRAHLPGIEEVVEEQLDAVAARAKSSRSPFDLIEDFALRVPIRVICNLLDVPEAEHGEFVSWGRVLGGTLDGVRTMSERREVRRAIFELGAYADHLIARRRAAPGDDIVSQMLLAEVDSMRLSRRDVVATVGLLIGAGFETTVNLIGNAVHTLIEDDHARHQFIDHPDSADKVVEEVLRFESPVQFTGRMAAEPVTVAGRSLPEGALILTLLGGANRDPDVFADPAKFDPNRPNNRDHLSFSSGIHYCVGAGLARSEGEIAVRALFTRFPDLHFAGRPRRAGTRNLRGWASLPVAV